jgi:hypothetical protein
VVDSAAVSLGDCQRVVGGARIDEDHFMRDAVGFLPGDGLQQGLEMCGLVERANDDADLNVAQIDDPRGLRSRLKPGRLR